MDSFLFNPLSTPKIIKQLLTLLVLFSLTILLIDPLLSRLFGFGGFQEWFSLSFWGWSHYLLFQPFTYLFIPYTDMDGLTLGHLLSFFFNLLFFWFLGSSLVERLGERRFLTLFLISSALAGCIALSAMPLFESYPTLSGLVPALLTLFVIWTQFSPSAVLWLFFLLPIQAKWLLALTAGAVLVSSLSLGHFVAFVHYVSALVIGYLWGVIGFDLLGPFTMTHPLDWKLIKWSHQGRKLFHKVTRQTPDQKGQVIDLQTGKPRLNDEEFIDAMLEKISKRGEKTLSWEERRRMEEISRKKSQVKR